MAASHPLRVLQGFKIVEAETLRTQSHVVVSTYFSITSFIFFILILIIYLIQNILKL
jgi:hypothetical protein